MRFSDVVAAALSSSVATATASSHVWWARYGRDVYGKYGNYLAGMETRAHRKAQDGARGMPLMLERAHGHKHSNADGFVATQSTHACKHCAGVRQTDWQMKGARAHRGSCFNIIA